MDPTVCTIADVLALAARRDAGVWRVLRDLGRTLGRSLADFCVYVAPDKDIIEEHARCGGFPANRISVVSAVIDPSTGE